MQNKTQNFRKIGDTRLTPSGRIQVYTADGWESIDQMPDTVAGSINRVQRALRRLGFTLIKPILKFIKGVFNV